MSISIPFSTLVVVLLTLLGVYLLARIAPLFFPVLFGALLAVALTPCVKWIQRRGAARWAAIAITSTALAVLILAILALMIPPLVQELSGFLHNLPEIRQKAFGLLPRDAALRHYFERLFDDKQLAPQPDSLRQVVGAGNMILGGLTEVVLVFVFTVYLLIDGARVMTWIKAFFSPANQRKIEITGKELAPIITSYLFGQLVTSFFSFVFVFALMSILKIPNVLLGATLAFVFDILPVLGFFLSAAPVMIFAANVSSGLPFVVLGLFIAYHALENYVIVPWVYGSSMRVSSLVVFFSLLAAGLAAGIEGAIAILPIVASYPVIERIWLRPYISPRALEVHRELGTETHA